MSAAEFDACADDTALIEALMGAPAHDLTDLCLKLIVMTEFGQFSVFPKLAGLGQVSAEAKALIAPVLRKRPSGEVGDRSA